MGSPATDRDFPLAPGLIFLNHGSFGACPKPVLRAQQRLRARMERNPVRFLSRDLPDLLDAARRHLARFLGASDADLVFVRNATTGVNAVLNSLAFKAGDELLLTDHAYPACRKAVEAVARRTGASLRQARIPFPIASPDQAVAAILAAVTPRTRLAMLEHVTSPTGLVLPLARILPALNARGVEVLVDGAHGPGMLDLRLEALGATYYTGNLHKWCCAPKGAAFLWVRRDRRKDIRPPVISLVGCGAPDPFHAAFDWTGTDDPTPWLTAPGAIDWLAGRMPGGWPELRAHCRRLALRGQSLLAQALDQPPAAPPEMVGGIAAQPLPEANRHSPGSGGWCDALQQRLLERHHIEVPVIAWPAPPRRLIRLSAMVYNHDNDYRTLAEVVRSERAMTMNGVWIFDNQK